MRIIVDADACPRGARRVLHKVQKQHDIPIITVASFHHHIDNALHVTVGDERDAADLAIANRARAGDIVVTQDQGLAAIVLAKGAHCVAPDGRLYDGRLIGFQLETRHASAAHRRAGGRTRGPKARTEADDARFEHTLQRLVMQSKNHRDRTNR